MTDALEVFPFRITVDDKTVEAGISREALEDHFGAGDTAESQHAAYKANRKRIDSKAIECQRQFPEIPVLLGHADF